MYENNLYDLIKSYQNGNIDSIEKIIKKMSPIINKYVGLLNDDDFVSDFYFCVMTMITAINLDNFCDDNREYKLLSYLKKSIYHKYIELSKQKQKLKQHECEFDEASRERLGITEKLTGATETIRNVSCNYLNIYSFADLQE